MSLNFLFTIEISILCQARPLLTYALDMGELGGLVDPLLENNYIENEIFLMIEAAAACVRHSAAKRPRMGQVTNFCLVLLVAKLLSCCSCSC